MNLHTLVAMTYLQRLTVVDLTALLVEWPKY